MKPQATIEKTATGFVISKEEAGETEQLETHFESYQAALDFILDQGWQLKRERPDSSLHVETRFLKP
ncbi:hypothetical protein [Methylophaga sp.]|jgi:hypothetical protein|uniref:hypothetical protein n=1 Tax=Methylophaga sp. TaxID=2024840 RepID=UPI0013FF7C45|nr:hypothetical protein [Methylophaga sp.]MTI63493.1 hypothetical protein [Methylophaga sp.]